MNSTGQERAAAALRLDRADRAPVSAWGHTYDREWSAAELASTTVGIARRCGLDFVKLQIRATCFAEAFGAIWRFSGSATAGPVVEHAGGLDAGSWQRIADSEPHLDVLREQIEALAAVVKEVGPQTPCIQTVFSPGRAGWFRPGWDHARLLGTLRPE